MKGAEVGGVRAGAPPPFCLPGPPLMMSTAGVTCYQQDRRSDGRLSITSRGETGTGRDGTPPPRLAPDPRGEPLPENSFYCQHKDIFRKILIEHKKDKGF